LSTAWCLVFFCLGFALSAAAPAQDWIKLIDRERQFTIRFPGEPQATDTIWRTDRGTTLPARTYALERGTARYALTVADYSGAPDEEHEARALAVRQLKAKGDAVHDGRAYQDGLPGDHLAITTGDGRRIVAVVHLFEHRLYVAEASDVKGAVRSEPFVYSLIITHKDGTWLNLDRFNPEDINAFEDPY
jgi:hypothetical protein